MAEDLRKEAALLAASIRCGCSAFLDKERSTRHTRTCPIHMEAKRQHDESLLRDERVPEPVKMSDHSEMIELLEAIDNINIDMYESSAVDYFSLSVSTDGNAILVEFSGMEIWSSETDSREYDLEGSEDEVKVPIEPHLRAVLMAEITKMTSIKV